MIRNDLWKHIETRARVAAFAVCEIRVAECSTVVMACPAANRSAGILVLDRNGSAHLSGLRRAVANGVALVTIDALTASMIGVAENRLKHIPRRRRPAVRRKLVADIAGTDVAFGRVARIAVRMCIKARRDRLRGPRRRVARRTTFGRSCGPA